MKQTDLKDVPPEQVIVLMVDFQNAFCHPESHTVNDKINNEATARWANAFALRASELGASVVYSRQVYDPATLTPRQDRWDASEALCAKDTWGSELYVKPVPGSLVVIKNRFDIWQSRDFLDYIERRKPEGFVISGFELCCCVLFAVLGADERGYRYVVPQDLVSGIDIGDLTYNRAVREYLRYTHGAPESSETVLKELGVA
ncbi:MAG: cysteine hydrolase [Dehalococcoidales bacterium]|nr:MAG: cysteine hydrolase [Dehalococcoidales bacterium]